MLMFRMLQVAGTRRLLLLALNCYLLQCRECHLVMEAEAVTAAAARYCLPWLIRSLEAELLVAMVAFKLP